MDACRMSLWETSLLTFIDCCSMDGFETASEAVLAMAEILDEAPEDIEPLISPRADSARLSQLLEVDAHVSAAMELVGPLGGVLVSRSAIGSSSGMVKIVDEVGEGNFFAADPAIALLGAYGTALVAVIAHIKGSNGLAS